MSTKIKIGIDQEAQNMFYRRCSDKMQLLTKAIKIFTDESKEQPENLEQFEKGFYDYALDYVSTKNPGGLSLGLSFQKYMEMYGYNFSKLKDLDTQYKAIQGAVKFTDGSFDVDYDGQDYTVYAESKAELEKYQDVTDLLNAMEVLHKKYIKGRNLQQTDFIGSFLQNDNGKIVPSWRFIKNH